MRSGAAFHRSETLAGGLGRPCARRVAPRRPADGPGVHDGVAAVSPYLLSVVAESVRRFRRARLSISWARRSAWQAMATAMYFLFPFSFFP
ncbi:hypothetical protein NDU88_001350 [Pleurodeles waltl]|uniref:Uncharacterized protein n=1 Tax=Pleurodeles waltl TaxID=8319 RepID=A0AAV7THL4_PLEWA|nr:hypothetical protein NDU88_001350 [Pleurodeles waltl]